MFQIIKVECMWQAYIPSCISGFWISLSYNWNKFWHFASPSVKKLDGFQHIWLVQISSVPWPSGAWKNKKSLPIINCWYTFLGFLQTKLKLRGSFYCKNLHNIL